ncbi:MAG: FAM83 family protein [Acidobacteriia bacterium]|nr:FAM83 family protein [Terriglobia bacterium]
MTEIFEETSPVRVIFSRTESLAEEIEDRIRAASVSIDAALYRFGNARLSHALCDAQRRGVSIRLIADRGKFEDSEDTRNLLSKSPFPFCLTHGRDGARSKMHHKFVILDEGTVLTGSYNWTFASEEQNYENLLILQDPLLVDLHRQEFDSLWASVAKAPDSGSPG